MSDFIAAMCAGIAQVSVGHPFDTVKTLIQNKQSYRNFQIKDYYRGAKYPLISSTLINSILFPIYQRSIETTQSGFISGMIGGFIISPIVFVFDTGKIRTQTQKPLTLFHLLDGHGKAMVFLRETIAFSVYFGVYDYLKQTQMNPFLAGSLAGLANWTVTYPIDVIKTRQIAEEISIKKAIQYGNLYRGYSICAFRSILVNAAIFGTYETVLQWL